MTLRLRTATLTDVGLVRDGNEDSVYAGRRLLAVADGMGGAAAGEVASSAAIDSLVPLDQQRPDQARAAGDGSGDDGADPLAALQAAVVAANDRIRAMTDSHPDLAGMGTTVTAMLWADERLNLAQVGDSRAYLLRDGSFTQITRDQTLVQMLVEDGRLTPEQAAHHPQRSVILNAVDGHDGIEPALSVREVAAGDRYLLCSDGLSDYVAGERIASALAEPEPHVACRALVDLALDAGAPDNVTCLVCDVVDDDGAEDAAAPVLAGAVTEAPQREFERDADTAVTTLGAADTAGAPASPGAGVDARALARVQGRRRTRRDRPRHRSITRRLLAVGLVVVVLVAAAVVATTLYVHRQWYVAADASTQTVGVYQGVQGSALGEPLSHLHSPTDIPVTALPQADRARLSGGIGVGSRTGATTAVTNLRADACAAATATPTASPLQTSAATTHHRRTGATPAPAPTPAWCQP